MISSMLDYDEEVLQLAIKNLQGKEKDSEGFQINNGLIYNPKKLFAKIDNYTEKISRDFFEQGGIYEIIPIVTEKKPGEVVQALRKDFGVDPYPFFCITETSAPFRTTEKQAKSLLEGLTKNPERYRASQEK
jgi:hypothetical protein